MTIQQQNRRMACELARGYDRIVHGQSYFLRLMRPEESVVLDLKDDAERALAARLTGQTVAFVGEHTEAAQVDFGTGPTEDRSHE